MKTISTRQEILEFLIDVEINPKEILKTKIEHKNKLCNDWLNNQLKTMIELYLLDNDYTKKDFNNTLQSITKNVTNKFN